MTDEELAKYTKKEIRAAKRLTDKLWLSWEQNIPVLASALRKVRQEERERCAKVAGNCEQKHGDYEGCCGTQIAQEIRRLK